MEIDFSFRSFDVVKQKSTLTLISDGRLRIILITIVDGKLTLECYGTYLNVDKKRNHVAARGVYRIVKQTGLKMKRKES